jgi:hypothetical protein
LRHMLQVMAINGIFILNRQCNNLTYLKQEEIHGYYTRP